MLFLLWDKLSNLSIQDIFYAFYIGSKFDLRIAILMTIPLYLIFSIPIFQKYFKKNTLGIISFYALLFTFIFFIYSIDFGYFFYLQQRVDSTLFDFLDNATISLHMILESYPIFWILFCYSCYLLLFLFITTYILKRYKQTNKIGLKNTICWVCLTILVLFLCAYGQINATLFPLRWSNAYFSINKNLALLALNPIQNLYDTYKITRSIPPDLMAVHNSYDRMANWLDVSEPNKNQLNFIRKEIGHAQNPPLNIVIIIMESLAWPRTSLAPGNDNPTPNLKKLAADSLVFPLFFAPTRTTARAVFTTMTGIPDVNRSGGTSSRNPILIEQHLIMNEFKGYEKYYMLGGSASWANIRGMLDHNIKQLNLFEEGNWNSPSMDVWGISDLSLFRETIHILNTSPKPFIAVIQTSSFHRPYTIPKDNAQFIVIEPSKTQLQNYGYVNAAEYNSMRFADHALGEFFALARMQPWFKNTIFAIFGDHGLNDPSLNMSPGYLACRLQSNHVPLLLYAPGIIEPGEYPHPCGQPDVFPTLASLVGISYQNQAMGRNILNPSSSKNAKQFIAGEQEEFFRLVEGNYCYIKEKTEGLYDITSCELKNLIEIEPERAKSMREAAINFFATAKYMLYNNKQLQQH